MMMMLMTDMQQQQRQQSSTYFVDGTRSVQDVRTHVRVVFWEIVKLSKCIVHVYVQYQTVRTYSVYQFTMNKIKIVENISTHSFDLEFSLPFYCPIFFRRFVYLLSFII